MQGYIAQVTHQSNIDPSTDLIVVYMGQQKVFSPWNVNAKCVCFPLNQYEYCINLLLNLAFNKRLTMTDKCILTIFRSESLWKKKDCLKAQSQIQCQFPLGIKKISQDHKYGQLLRFYSYTKQNGYMPSASKPIPGGCPLV